MLDLILIVGTLFFFGLSFGLMIFLIHYHGVNNDHLFDLWNNNVHITCLFIIRLI